MTIVETYESRAKWVEHSEAAKGDKGWADYITDLKQLVDCIDSNTVLVQREMEFSHF